MGFLEMGKGTLGAGLISAVALLTSALSQRPARASCLAATPHLIWSYPADRSTGIPLNARFRALLPLGTESVALPLLNDRPVTAAADGGFELGALQPQTRYTLSWQVSQLGQTTTTLSVEFETGDAAADEAPPPTPTIASLRRYESADHSALCEEVLWTQDCFDTPPYQHLRIETHEPALGWLIEDVSHATFNGGFWPGECGLPDLMVHDSSRVCVRLRAFNAVGASSVSEEVCSEPGPSEEVPDGETGPDAGVPAGTGGAATGSGGSQSGGSHSPTSKGCQLRAGAAATTSAGCGSLALWALLLLTRRVASGRTRRRANSTEGDRR